MTIGQLSYPLRPPNADQLPIAIKTYLFEEVLAASRQPSPRVLVAELDHCIGVVARWDLLSVMKALSRYRDLTHAMRSYFVSLLEGDALIQALRGKHDPDREVVSTIDHVLCRRALYRSSAAYEEMVDFMSRFRDYAPYNLMFVRVQNPSCSFFATANDWRRRFERKVK